MKLIKNLDEELEEIFMCELDGRKIIQEKSSLVLQDYFDTSSISCCFIDSTLSELDKMMTLKNNYIYTSSDCELF